MSDRIRRAISLENENRLVVMVRGSQTGGNAIGGRVASFLDGSQRAFENAPMPFGDVPLVSLQTAWDLIAKHVRPGPSLPVPLSQAAGRVLAEPVRAARDHPPFDRAVMDGYAICSSDARTVPVDLAIVGEVHAGRMADRPLRNGEAMRINTGAPLPSGADAVVPVEKTTEQAGRVRIAAKVDPGACVAGRGSDVRANDAVLTPPVRLGAAQIGAAAAAGATQVVVYRQPRLAIVLTGDEIVATGGSLKDGQIFDCNGPALTALARQCGADANEPMIAGDNPQELRTKLERALTEPVIVTVGGMSKGTRDLVPTTFAELGVHWMFHGVDLRPGKPTAYGVGPAGRHVIGLPGNPVSAFVCFHLFVRLILDGLQGLPARPPALRRARLIDPPRPSNDARPVFLPAALDETSHDLPSVHRVEWHGSGDPFGLARANALLYQPRGNQPIAPGATVEVLPFER